MAMMRPDFVFIMSMIILSFSLSYGLKFNVGGKDGWGVKPSQWYGQWAEKNRFQINDTLYFKYTKGSDSVLVVSKEDYHSCNVWNPIQKLDGGDSTFTLDKSGPFFFISGIVENCKNGEKLIVVVLSPNHGGHHRKQGPSSAPSPAWTPKSNAPSPSLKPSSPAWTPAWTPKSNAPSPSLKPSSPTWTPTWTPASNAPSPALTPSGTHASNAPSPSSKAPSQAWTPAWTPTSNAPAPSSTSPSPALTPASTPTSNAPSQSVAGDVSPAPSPAHSGSTRSSGFGVGLWGSTRSSVFGVGLWVALIVGIFVI